MGHLPLIDELAIVAGIAVAVTVVLARLRIPAVAGLLLAGALVGPNGLGWVPNAEDIEVLAEVGVVLLLFTIGLEFSLERLSHIFGRVAVGGLLQVGLTTAAVAGGAVALGATAGQGLYFGFVFALSSTAIVLRALGERRELDAPHGRFIVGVLIFQDLLVVPMVLVVPLLGGEAGSGGAAALSVLWALTRAALVVVAVVVGARVVVPRALGWVDRSRSREMFLIAILGLCIGTAWLTSQAGLSLALGAFLGGMVVAGTPFGHRAMGDVLPFRDVFVSLFFVSLGMLFDVRVVAQRPVLVLGLFAAFLALKGGLATVSAMAMRFPARAAWLAGVGLAQFGEFGFVLARLAEKHGVVTAADNAPVLAAGIASMFVTPMLVRVAPHLHAGERLLAPLEKLLGVRAIDSAEPSETPATGHVVVVGYGVAGRLAARALSASKVPYLVLELNADAVRTARGQGLPVFYADATSEEALGHAHLATARALVLLMNDPQAARRVVETAKRVAPGVPVMLRARYLAERTPLLDAGVRDVVAEEVEGAVEVMSRLLRWLEVPRNDIESRIREARGETQSSERKLTLPRPSLPEMRALDDLKVDSVRVEEGWPSVGKSIADLRVRSETGALVVAVRRGLALLEHPDPTVPFQAGDIVYFVGSSAAVRKAMERLAKAG